MTEFEVLFRECFNDGITIGQSFVSAEERETFFQLVWNNFYRHKVEEFKNRNNGQY